MREYMDAFVPSRYNWEHGSASLDNIDDVMIPYPRLSIVHYFWEIYQDLTRTYIICDLIYAFSFTWMTILCAAMNMYSTSIRHIVFLCWFCIYRRELNLLLSLCLLSSQIADIGSVLIIKYWGWTVFNTVEKWLFLIFLLGYILKCRKGLGMDFWRIFQLQTTKR